MLALISVIVGLAAGIGFAVLGQKSFTAVGAGAAALAFVFTAGMSVIAHLNKQDRP
ncbi:hypothetical protein [Streptomyces goshikiensis]|uniref:hypothetical protein n=1 Tax=Streptomyces goshikiensis TaxID=1942 RepID=UPI003646C2F6